VSLAKVTPGSSQLAGCWVTSESQQFILLATKVQVCSICVSVGQVLGFVRSQAPIPLAAFYSCIFLSACPNCESTALPMRFCRRLECLTIDCTRANFYKTDLPNSFDLYKITAILGGGT
jgi:hypothetical protein